MTRWHYQGDINLEHGGLFIDVSEWKHGYADVVEVSDLDGACGFRGAILIESKSAYGTDDPNRIAQALAVIGASLLPNGDIDNDDYSTIRKGTLIYKLMVIYALNASGYSDVDRSETVQPERDCPTTFDGWTARRIRAGSLRSYVRKQFLGLKR